MKDRVKKLEEFLEKHSKIMLIAIFVIGIIMYGFLAKKMTSPTFIDVDEELYVSMARSFFFEGHFAKNYEVLSYNCVLYSMIISIAYLFKPIHIALVMRLIGVLLMVSSIFPIYLLAKNILKSKAKAIIISAFSLLLPEYLLSLYLVQEVLCYPMFLWISYLAYLHFTYKKNKWLDIRTYFSFSWNLFCEILCDRICRSIFWNYFTYIIF